MTTLSGKTALVTGASRGMGRASALALAGMGAQVLVHYSSGVREAEAVVAEIRKAGGRADAVAADLSAPDGPHKLAKQVRAVVGGRLDILVANAGISKAATIEETPSRISTGSSRSMSAHRSFLCSNSFRSCRREAVLFSSRLWRRAQSLAQFQPMQQPRAPLAPW